MEGLNACKLCTWQLACYALLFVFSIFLAKKIRLLCLIALLGFSIAVYHTGLVYAYFEDFCPVALERTGLDSFLEDLEMTEACTSVPEFFNLPLPLYSAALFFLIFWRSLR